MTVKKDDYKIFNNYYEKAKQLFADGKPIPKEMLTYLYIWRTTAHKLALYSDRSPYWQTNDKEILILRDEYNYTVAHYLATCHPSWITNDPEILYLKGDKNRTVKEILVKKIMAGEKKDGS